ncbi:cation-translocating P-type ATPase [Kineothrix sedimenti]|uniref:Cd(2+)-exporting ATPase n=1 Tax=Kineothrix sedimenti TaxID=3123317 RepID=A0ABZ3F161_9FIRM
MMKKIEELLEWGGVKKDITSLIISALALLASLLDFNPFPFPVVWIAIILCGVPIILEALLGLITAFDIKADVLVSIALIASIVIGETFAAGEVAFIMQLGALLENLTVAKARAGIEKLVRLTPRTARKIIDCKEQTVPAELVHVGDILRVLPGETIPVDGRIRSGQTSINQAVMTGESLPVDKGAGDFVSSGTVNQFGSFDMEATKVGEDSSIQRMIRLVQSAAAGKAKIVGVADRWATWIVIIALTAAGLTWLISGEIIRAVTILVVFCPCALVLATPTAIMAAIGNATRHGFLVREGDALERLAGVERITFDKTGTLTYGQPQVVAVHSFKEDLPEEELYLCSASAEQHSEHPLGKAVVRSYKSTFKRELYEAQRFHMLPGRGVQALIDGREITAGNPKLFSEKQIGIGDNMLKKAEEYLNDGCTVIFVAIQNETAGIIALADTLRQDAVTTMAEVKKTGVIPVLLTGDNENAAGHIARQLHIDEVHFGCLPEDKLKWIDSYQKNQKQVCMIGDGINDAPALKRSYVGIAMGGSGSDIAVEAADIALINDEIKELPHLLRLSKRMMLTIKCNLTFSMALNFIAVVLAIAGILNPVAGALVHNAGSVIVIVNSTLLLKWKKRNGILL